MISFYDFDKAIRFIQERAEEEQHINDVFTEIYNDCLFFPYTKYEEGMVRLLAAATSSEGYNSIDDITYFIYDLDYGRNWVEGSCDYHDEDIKLQSTKNLYDFIVRQNKEAEDEKKSKETCSD